MSLPKTQEACLADEDNVLSSDFDHLEPLEHFIFNAKVQEAVAWRCLFAFHMSTFTNFFSSNAKTVFSRFGIRKDTRNDRRRCSRRRMCHEQRLYPGVLCMDTDLSAALLLLRSYSSWVRGDLTYVFMCILTYVCMYVWMDGCNKSFWKRCLLSNRRTESPRIK